ncbi:hypothetical protein MZD03_15590 [Escherichia coli]|nr:hypothetical protein [Escherichia coli]MCQ5791308.1 hypothetical protein [Escherichia coli]MCQ5815619.1 hypothetical protein [Escherichia coli]MCQ5858851.1 hypothetical protein [Escherichia coli]MCQ5893420.1 hypothetical protein [Escherichia coli]MCQ5898624.1 hypothetical protein [Escherichia coli]
MLDGWIKRKLRCLLWLQWKRPGTRTKNRQRAGLSNFSVQQPLTC